MSVSAMAQIMAAGGPVEGKQTLDTYRQGKSLPQFVKGLANEGTKNSLTLQAAQGAASERAAQTIRQRAQSMTQSIFTNPLGIGGQAQVARKTLLGQ
jgi:hypothetical protein